MTWADLEQVIDTTDLSRRTYAVLRAFSRCVNPPTETRPYPDNLIVWPSLDTVMGDSRYGLDSVQHAKRELVQQGILELVEPACRARGGHGRAPRYRINEQKLPRDEAAWARQTTQRARRDKGRAVVAPEPEKGREISDPFPEKGREIPPPEVSRKTKDPEGVNFSKAADGLKTRGRVTHTDDKATPETLAPPTLPLSDDVLQWAVETVPELNLPWQLDKFLCYARAHKTRNADWIEAFKLWCMNAYERWLEKQATGYPTNGEAPARATEAPDAPRRRVTCGFAGCDEPPCGHGPQSCRRHGLGSCHDCLAEAATDAEPPDSRASVAMVRVDADLAPVPMVEPDDGPPQEDADRVPSWPAEAPQPPRTAWASGALMTVGAVLSRDPKPVSAWPLPPLGSGGPRLTVRGHLRALLTEEDQPTLQAAQAKRQAREARDAPPLAVD